MTTLLTPEETARYDRDGYLSYNKPVFAPEKFARLQAIFEEDLTRFSEAELDMIHKRDERLLEFLLSDEVLDLVEPLTGGNIGLWASHLISKSPFTGKATPWHEDSAYWNGRVSTMAGICTVWLALDKATPENGSMGVIPGSHVNGFSEYEAVDAAANIFSSEVKAGTFDESKAVYFSLQPNECSLHEGRIIHGANANTSPMRRAGYTMRYFPLTSRVFQDNPRNAGHKIWLARGTDQAGNTFENA
ncbi:MAG: phytanoyl-CoA dioxygenase family protein [Armatimonadetes bacterium]|nr:phytanoyl-CoA dioxygenase family protein [Armatimonadota bacterium]